MVNTILINRHDNDDEVQWKGWDHGAHEDYSAKEWLQTKMIPTLILTMMFATISFKRRSVGGNRAPPPHILTIMKKFDDCDDDKLIVWSR